MDLKDICSHQVTSSKGRILPQKFLRKQTEGLGELKVPSLVSIKKILSNQTGAQIAGSCN